VAEQVFPADASPRVFISYRTADSSAQARLLRDGLAARFGGDRVFFDVESIRLGVDFTESVPEAIALSDVVIVLIGTKWLTVTDKNGNRRLDSPDDPVREEVELALRSGARVIPVLVEEAGRPVADELPASLATLPRLQTLELRDRRWPSDLAELISELEAVGGVKSAEAEEHARLQAERKAAVLAEKEQGLTSVADPRPFGFFRLPFTLVNLAGWMLPLEEGASPGLLRGIRGLVHVLAALLTATYVFALGVILVDIVGFQWAGRIAGVQRLVTTGIASEQKIGVAVGLLALTGVVAGLVYASGTSQAVYEQERPPVLDDPKGDVPWSSTERLTSGRFFFHPEAAKRRWRWHVAVAGACWFLVLVVAVWRVYVSDMQPQSPLGVGRLQTGCSGLAYVVLALLWATSLGVRRKPGEQWSRSGPAIAATLAVGLVDAIGSGTMLLLVKLLNRWPESPVGAPVVQGGSEVNLLDVWGGLVIAFGLAAVIFGYIVAFSPRARTDDLPERSSPPGYPADGLDGWTRRSVARARYLAIVARRGWSVAFVVAFTMFFAVSTAHLLRVNWTGWPSLAAPTNTGAPLYQVGAYIIPALVLRVVFLVGFGRPGVRTAALMLRDFLTFWPRRFSPFAVPPYPERAVPKLQGRILFQMRDGEDQRPLVLGVEGQGSVVAFAALSSMPAERLKRVALVTCGSPISTLYGALFPAYFGPDQVELLRDKLATPADGLVGWRNFYRQTDPIGGPVFLKTTTPEADTELADVSFGPDVDVRDTARIAGHSNYMQEPAVRDWLKRVRTALDP